MHHLHTMYMYYYIALCYRIYKKPSHTHARTHTHTRTHMHTHACTHTHTHTCTPIHTHSHTHAHTLAHTCTHMHALTHIHTHTHNSEPGKADDFEEEKKLNSHQATLPTPSQDNQVRSSYKTELLSDDRNELQFLTVVSHTYRTYILNKSTP